MDKFLPSTSTKSPADYRSRVWQYKGNTYKIEYHSGRIFCDGLLREAGLKFDNKTHRALIVKGRLPLEDGCKISKNGTAVFKLQGKGSRGGPGARGGV